MPKQTETTDLDDYTTKELLDEIERRKSRKVVKMRVPWVYKCRCGFQLREGEVSKDAYVDFGHLWHVPCMPPRGQISSNFQMSMGDVNVRR